MVETWLSLIAAVVTGLLSLWGVYASNRKGAAVMEYRMDQMEKTTAKEFDEIKADLKKHNNMMERLVKLEGRVTETEHDIRDIKASKNQH